MKKLLILFLLSPLAVAADDTPRARDLGIPFEGTPGPLNAITDIEGVQVGFETIIEDLAEDKAVRPRNARRV